VFRRGESAEAAFAWEFLSSLPANASLQYSYVAATASDSIAGYNPRTYSVDNLSPSAPAAFTGAYANGATTLDWAPNGEVDFATYRLYRGSTAGFVPDPRTLVVETSSEGYTHPGAAGGYYKLAAVDIHGNVSPYAVLSPAGTIDVGPAVPKELALGAPRPNPARGECVIPVALPRDAELRMEILDVSGRRVRDLAPGEMPAGDHLVRWDGRDGSGRAVHNGLYFVRMRVENRVFRSRVLLAR
jgi:hypothetical protein